MMNKKLVLIGSSILLMSTFAQADDIDIKDEATQQTRTQLQDRIQSMSDEERALYRSMNENKERNGAMNRHGQGNGNGSGKMNRYGQGNDNSSGNMNRYERGNSDGSGGYGSGYGSRQGGGHGSGGKGRGH